MLPVDSNTMQDKNTIVHVYFLPLAATRAFAFTSESCQQKEHISNFLSL
jgi:hypothetical protein